MDYVKTTEPIFLKPGGVMGRGLRVAALSFGTDLYITQGMTPGCLAAGPRRCSELGWVERLSTNGCAQSHSGVEWTNKAVNEKL